MEFKNLIDGLGRRISYLRLSLTDRCDLRCVYCMSARPKFLPKSEILSPEEIERLIAALTKRGLAKIRLTGGEPLVRRDFMDIAERISRYNLQELTLTTNATRLPDYADALYALGMRRVNISLDSLCAEKFSEITRGGDLSKTLQGIDAAQAAGLDVKINMVALAGINEDEIPAMIGWAHQRNIALTLIETMPMSDTGFDLTRHYLSLEKVKRDLEKNWRLEPEEEQKPNAGPARYVRVAETGGRLGFITPLSNNFCAACNRMRITATGKLYLCLGHNDAIDLRPALREQNDAALHPLLDKALPTKAAAHNFFIGQHQIAGSPGRMMTVTGG